MAVSKVTLSSNAFILLGSRGLSSFDEESSEASIASSLYESTYLDLLTNHRWRFATKKVKLARLLETPLNDYDYAFQIPGDCIKVIAPTTQNYEIYGSKIYANQLDLDLDYMTRVDEDLIPPSFAKTLEFYLAAQFAIPLTGDLNKADFYLKAYSMQLVKTKFEDSSQRPADTFADSAYIETRY